MSLANIIDEPTLATATVATSDYNVQGSPFLVISHIDDAAAVGDITGATIEVRAYARDGSTLLPNVLTPTSSEAGAFAGGVAAQMDVFDTVGYHKIQVSIEHATGGPQDVQVDVGFSG